MAEAFRTIGTTLTRLQKNTEGDLVIANLTKVGSVGIESEEIDTTTLDSTGGYKEFIAGSKDAGTVDLEGLIKDPEILEKLLGYAETQTVEKWKIDYPTGDKWEFDGFIKSFKDGEKTPEGLGTFTASIRISGKPTFTKKV